MITFILGVVGILIGYMLAHSIIETYKAIRLAAVRQDHERWMRSNTYKEIN